MIIIYYDRQLKSSDENIDNFIKLRKTFYGNEIYGVYEFDKFKYLLSLFLKTCQSYYIILSGSGAKEFFNSGYYEENKNRIIGIFIYCLNIDQYLPLKKVYPRISMIENISFDNIIKDIQAKESLSYKEDDILKQYSSFLILEEYFLKAPSQIHEKICEYFDENYNKPSFDENAKKKILNLLNLIAQTKKDFNGASKILEDINDEKDLIKCYTDESIIVYFLNKCLREVNNKMLEFVGLMNYALFKYYHDNPQIEIKEDMIFYRKMNIPIKDLYSYDLFEGKIICFPAFTSTSIYKDAFYFNPIAKDKTVYGVVNREKHILLKIYYKFNEAYQCPCFNIQECSKFKDEKEYLFNPFSFFKILKIIMNEGTEENPVIIELKVIPKAKDFQKNLKNGGKVLFDEKEEYFKCIECKKPINKEVNISKEIKHTGKAFSPLERVIVIETALNKIKIKPIDISDALLLYDENVLTNDKINLLMPIIPTDNEYDEISKKTESLENEEDFAVCDLFIILIGCIYNNKERLQAMKFKNNYHQQCEEVLELMKQILIGFDFVKNDYNFHHFLEILSEQGNPILDEKDKGGSFGLKLSSLPKLYKMKSNNGEGKHFQNIIREKVGKNMLSFMSNLKLFDTIQIKRVKELYNSLKDNFESVETLKKMLETNKDLDEDDKTEEFLKGFYTDANKYIQLINENYYSIKSQYKDISELLGLNKANIEEFISIMIELRSKIVEALKT